MDISENLYKSIMDVIAQLNLPPNIILLICGIIMAYSFPILGRVIRALIWIGVSTLIIFLSCRIGFILTDMLIFRVGMGIIYVVFNYAWAIGAIVGIYEISNLQKQQIRTEQILTEIPEIVEKAKVRI